MVMVIMGCIWSATWRSTHMFLLNRHGNMSLEWFRMHGNDSTKNVSWVMTDANPLPSSFTKLCLNVARMVPLMYSYDTNSPSKLEEYVKSLLYGGAMQNISENQTIVSWNDATYIERIEIYIISLDHNK